MKTAVRIVACIVVLILLRSVQRRTRQAQLVLRGLRCEYEGGDGRLKWLIGNIS